MTSSPMNYCPQCSFLAATIRFTPGMASEFRSFHERLILDFVQKGVLLIVDGDLQWSDYIECGLRCAKCERRFRLTCETYHGSGGEWRPE